MARSSWKFQYINSFLYKNMFLSKYKNTKISKIFNRNSVVVKFLCKKSFYLYKGNLFPKIPFTKFMQGYKIGEFSITRKPFSFPLKKKSKR